MHHSGRKRAAGMLKLVIASCLICKSEPMGGAVTRVSGTFCCRRQGDSVAVPAATRGAKRGAARGTRTPDPVITKHRGRKSFDIFRYSFSYR